MPVKRRTFRKKSRSSKSKQIKAWRKAVRKIAVTAMRRKSELLTKKLTMDATLVGGVANGYLYSDFFDISQGTADSNRVGNKISARGIHIQARVLTPRNTSGLTIHPGNYQVRVVVVSSPDIVLVAADFPQNTHECLDRDKLPGHILRDYRYHVSSFTATSTDLVRQQHFKIWVPLKQEFKYDDTSVAPINRRVYLYMICSGLPSTAQIDFDGCYRTFFKEV